MAAPAGTEAAGMDFQRRQNSSASFLDEGGSPVAGKRAAMSAYCWGVLPLESCQRLFNRNPAWRSA